MAFDGPFDLDRYVRWAKSPYGATVCGQGASPERLAKAARNSHRNANKKEPCEHCGKPFRKGMQMKKHVREAHQ